MKHTVTFSAHKIAFIVRQPPLIAGLSGSSWTTHCAARPIPSLRQMARAILPPNTDLQVMDTDFYRMKRLPPYVIAEVNAMRAEARKAGRDIIDLGMGNPDLPPPQHVIDKL